VIRLWPLCSCGMLSLSETYLRPVYSKPVFKHARHSDIKGVTPVELC
jgi:hypothetical protein